MDATSSILWRRSKLTRAAFNAVYDTFVRPGGFHELNSYYSVSRERSVPFGVDPTLD